MGISFVEAVENMADTQPAEMRVTCERILQAAYMC